MYVCLTVLGPLELELQMVVHSYSVQRDWSNGLEVKSTGCSSEVLSSILKWWLTTICNVFQCPLLVCKAGIYAGRMLYTE